jgi:site-specific recombinase XerD
MIFRRHIIPFFKNTRLDLITPFYIQSYISQKLKEGISPATIRRHLVPFKTMLKYAVRWNYLKENPSEYVEMPAVRER